MQYENQIIHADALAGLQKLPDQSVHCAMTSPPYWALRDYGVEGQLGLENTVEEFVEKLCDIFDEVKRVLRDDGTCWVNMGDTYAGADAGSRWNTGHNIPGGKKKLLEMSNGSTPKKLDHSLPSKCLTMVPFRFSIEMANRGWILRNTIIWQKPNCMPHSVQDRFTVDFEYLFFFSKSRRYHFERQYEKQKLSSVARMSYSFGGVPGSAYPNEKRDSPYPKQWKPNPAGRNKRCVWRICPQPYPEAHFATYPEKLCETPIRAGAPPQGIVLDPFFGSGTTGAAALKNGRNFVGIEISEEYVELARRRLRPLMNEKLTRWA